MARFTDAEGRDWSLTIDAPKIFAIRSEFDPEFLKGDFESRDSNTYARLLSDPATLCGVIFVLCAEDRGKRGIEEREFYLGVMGDAIDAATAALLEAIKSFIPRRTREVLAAFAAADEAQQQAMRKAIAAMPPDLAAKLSAKVEEELQKGTPPSSVASSPASSASTPAA